MEPGEPTAPVGPADDETDALDGWAAAFTAFWAPCAVHFRRREVRERSGKYVRGLLGPVPRKNGWQVAEAIGERDPVGVQRLLFAARWDERAVQDTLIRTVAQQWGTQDGVFILDETGFLKKGRKSVGVQRQYSGTAGKVDNCQVAVFLAYATAQGHAFLDRRLYLPQEWTDDPARCAEAGVPPTVLFQTKPALGWDLLCHAWDLGVAGRWVVGDTVYGRDPALRAHLETQAPARHYVLAVPADTRVWTEVTATVREAGRPGPLEARAYQVLQEATVATYAGHHAQWTRLAVAAGTKGPRTYDWWAGRVQGEATADPAATRWLLVRRALRDPHEQAYYVSNAPADTPLRVLAQVASQRWAIEQGFEEAKGETGLDQYEVRQWQSWHRHVTLALVAHTFLANLRRQALPLPPHPSPEVGVGGKGHRGRRLLAIRYATHSPRAHSVDRPRSAAPARSRPASAGTFPHDPPALVALATTPSGHRPPLLLRPSPATTNSAIP